MKNSYRILVLAQDPSIRDLVADILSPQFQISAAADVLEATDRIGLQPHHMLILDPNLPILDGVEYVRLIRRFAEYDSLSILALSSYPPHLQQLGNDIQGALSEPFNVSELQSLVASTLQRSDRKGGSNDGPGGHLSNGQTPCSRHSESGAGANMLKAVVFGAWMRATAHRAEFLRDRATAIRQSAGISRDQSRVIRAAARSARESRQKRLAAPLTFSPS